MQENRLSELQAALERAAATLRNSGSAAGSGSGLFAPMPFGGPGMFNPTPMANQGQPGMQPTPNAQVANRFGGMQPPSPGMTPNQYVAQNFPQSQQAMAYAPPDPNRGNMTVPMPQPRPAEAPQAQPSMGFFQRNAAMMRDPVTGAFIDPQGSAAAGDQGSIIKKMLGLLHNKADNA